MSWTVMNVGDKVTLLVSAPEYAAIPVERWGMLHVTARGPVEGTEVEHMTNSDYGVHHPTGEIAWSVE